MGVLETVLKEVFRAYLPFVDENALQVDLLRGTCRVVDLDYVVQNPSFSFLGQLPFALKRVKAALVESSVSWNAGLDVRVDVKDVHFWFRQQEWSEDVDEIVKTARERRLKRQLAEGERASIPKWKQGLLSGLLNSTRLQMKSVQVTVELVSGVSISFALDRLNTSSPFQKAQPALKKHIEVEAFTITASTNEGENLAVLKPLSLVADLTYSSGIFALDVPFVIGLCADIDTGIVDHVLCLSAQHRNWQRAVINKRPSRTRLKQTALDWWHYAIRCTSGCKPILAEETLLTMIRRSQRYIDLHIKRLQKADNLSDEERLELVELENTFDSDMILLLRRKARSRVRAEVASQFARQGWMSWLLFGSNVSSKQNRVREDMLRAIESLQEDIATQTPFNESELPLSESRKVKDWSRVVVETTVPQTVISLCHDGE